MRAGVIDGDLYVVGGGDPLLQTTGDQPSQEDPNEPYNDFAKLATAIKAAGITAIHGNVVGDESQFDTQRYVPSWPGRYITAGEVGPAQRADGQRRVHRADRRPRGARPPTARPATRPRWPRPR